ncbi:HKD family nuclease [Bradyrhizobium sp. USDA 4516]
MNVRFIALDPRNRAQPDLDNLLSHGTDQLAIACAFLTPGGVETLKRHAARLKQPNSFVVVAWDTPTSLDALNELHTFIPGKLYVHLGSLTPVERGVGPGLMHSKVFFARAGEQCRLWTGSHNLTASAMQGVNCEAAVLIEGNRGEAVFTDALTHLNQCRAEAMLFDPLNPPPPLTPEQTLVIHAECHTVLKPHPWFVHLLPDNTDYDKAMRPPAAVWLYLYDRGTLQPGTRRPSAVAAYSGTLTALNFTERHPRYRGISADWSAADYVVEFKGGIPCLTEPAPHRITPSQGILRMETKETTDTVWLTESPKPALERVVGEQHLSQIDPEFRQFFTTKSLRENQLLHQQYRSVRTVIRIPRKEMGFVEPAQILTRLEAPGNVEIVIDEGLEAEDRFAFIYRAKYRT